MKKLAIIPAYNEEGNIDKTVRDLVENAPDFDYVIINDCSKDRTAAICREKGYPMLNLPLNLGIGGAVQSGYRYALENHYDLAVQFDGDGQHNASFLQKMADTMEKDSCDMVIGSRFIEKHGFQSSWIRQLGIHFFTWLIHLMTGTTITDPTSGLRMIGRPLIRQFADSYPGDYPEPESVAAILKQGKKVEEIPVIMNERTEGTSSISPKKAVYYMVKVSLAVIFAAGAGRKEK